MMAKDLSLIEIVFARSPPTTLRKPHMPRASMMNLVISTPTPPTMSVSTDS